MAEVGDAAVEEVSVEVRKGDVSADSVGPSLTEIDQTHPVLLDKVNNCEEHSHSSHVEALEEHKVSVLL